MQHKQFPVEIKSFSLPLPEIIGKRTAWSKVTPLPCSESEKKLSFFSESNRDVSTYLQTYGLSKFRKGSIDELTSYSAVQVIKFILFSSLFCKVLGEKTKISNQEI